MSSERSRSNDELLKVLEIALNASRDGFAIWKAANPLSLDNSDFELVFINHAGAAPTGTEAEKLRGVGMEKIIPESEAPALRKTFAECLRSHNPQHEVINVRTVAGWIGSYENTVIPLNEDTVLATFRDVSKEQADSQRMKWLVNHDSLTGLANRNLILQQLEDARTQLAGNGNPFAFGFIDIDNFKSFNDTYGHDFGDEVIKTFANQLQYVLHGSDQLARLSGDEFAIILNHIHALESIDQVYEKLKSSALEGWKIGDQLVRVEFSAGFIYVTSPNAESAELLHLADANMYDVKHSGKNGIKVTSYA